MNLSIRTIILLVLSFVITSEGIYDPNDGGVKNRPIVRERLNRQPYERLQQQPITPTDQVTIHDQYSQVSMQRSGRHFGRSDNSNVMRIARPGSSSAGNQRPYAESQRREPLAQFQFQQPSQSAAASPQGVHSRFEPDVAENEVGVSYGTECPANATGHFPYVMDCRQYLNCWKGRGYIQSCSPGTLFNPDTNVCDHPSKVVCITFNSAPGEQERPSTAETRRYSQQQTSGRLQFPPRTQNAPPPPPSPSVQSRGFTEDAVQCAPGSSGLTEHPYDCSKFLNCANGVTYIQSCGPGTVFNPLFNVCDWPHNVNCGSKSSSDNQADNTRQPYYGEGKIDMRGDDDDDNDDLTRSGSTNQRGIYQRPQYSGTRRGSVTTEDSQSVLVPSLDLQPPTQPQNQWGPLSSYDRTKGSRNYPQGQSSDRKYPVQSRFDNPDALPLPSMELQPPVESPKPGQQSSHSIPIYNRPGNQYPQTVQSPSEVLQPPPYSSGQASRQYPSSSGNKGRQEPSTFVIGLIPPPPQDQVPENSQWSDNQQKIVNQWQLPWQSVSTQQPEVTVTFYPSHSRPYYNHQTTSTTPPSQQSQLNAALQMLLKPYMRGSQHSNSTDAMNFTDLFTTTPLPPMSGEQESLNQGGEWRPRPQGPTESGEDVHLPDGSILPPGHSLEWHRAHPHVPLPKQLPDGRMVPPGHSLEWHQAHPDVPLPDGDGHRHNHNRHGHHHHNRHHGHGPHHHHGHHPHSHHNHHHHHHRGGVPESTTPTTETLSTPPPSIDERFSVSSTPEFVPLHPSFANQAGVTLCAGQFNCSNDFCVPQDMICDGKNDCGNWKDESDCNHIGFEIRLSSDQGAAHEGRLEVKVYDQWGYVCDDKFDMRDANVICRELGFPLGAAEVRGNSYYPPHRSMLRGEDSAIFLVDELDCRGNEKSLRECDFSGWGVHDCNAEEVVGVVCKVPVMTCPLDYWLCDTSQECIPLGFLCDSVPDCTDHSDEDQRHCAAPIEVRLIGGQSNLEGRVEIKYRQIWGTVCDDDFNVEEANVICRSLGFYGPSYVMKNTFGPGTGIIWLDQVDCLGNETSIEQCSHWHWGEHNCAHSEDVGIRCSHGEPTEYSVRRSSARNTLPFGSQLDSRISGDGEDVEIKVQFPPVECGQVKVRPQESEWGRHVGYKVINGSNAQRGFHPWQAAIRVRGTGKSSHWCGAVLISEQHLLTAAHCLIGFSKGAYIIRLGDHNADIVEPMEVEAFIENLYIHEDFRKDHHMNNDIAIIVLKSPVAYTDHIQPICLPSKNTFYFPGMKCTISGWGSIQSGKSNVSAPSLELRAGTVPIISDDTCREPHVYGNVISDGMFCAGSLDEGVDSCMGDSGGGLVCENDGVHKLYGIISWGQRCGYANKPGVYVKVSQYIDWIWSKLNGTLTP